ncbi:hypothetical protein WA1_01015 [Scytonema hofmannii PCC 7110]|uniref:Carbohydrate-binding domain-containing protein n=1 Tax=Scytonema hofmannii PCC 7110 TaxID=128403 RepID=A0A139XGF9_9CYAN|nr:hypothetical protein [Scytonema hofmannii]KYC43777.1 hypothetical protein WA1_01015 [Scytonema hofmannii PCC 7110]
MKQQPENSRFPLKYLKPSLVTVLLCSLLSATCSVKSTANNETAQLPNKETTQLPNNDAAQLPPRYTGLAPNSPFGLDFGYSDPKTIGAIAQDLGVKWIRGIQVEFDPWNGDPKILRDRINTLKSYGVSSLQTPFYPVDWKEKDKLGPPRNVEAYVQKFYNWVAATHDLMPYYEHWNEPWVDEWAWNGGTAEEYRDIIKRIWNKVKADYPNVNLIGGGSLAYNRDIMYAKGNDTGYADGSVNHAYAFPSLNTFHSVLMQLTVDKKFSKTQGRAGAWQTEFGTFRDMYSSNQDIWVARTIPSSYLIHMLAGYYAQRPVRAFWFNWSGHGTHDIANNDAAKDAYRTMTRVLEGTKIVDDVFPTSKSMWGIVFKNDYSTDNRARAALFVNSPFYGDIGNPWDPKGGSQAKGNIPSDEYSGTVSLGNSKNIQVYDYRGNRINNLSKIPLNPVEVVYIIADLPASQLKQILQNADFQLKNEIKVTALSLSGPVVKGRTIDIKVENVVNKPRSGTLAIAPPKGWTLSQKSISFENLQPGEQKIISFPIESFAVNNDNNYEISYSLSVKGKSSPQTGNWKIQSAYAPKKTINVDGNLQDWSDVIATSMGNGAYKFKVAWDSNNLYFAAEIADDKHAPFPPFDPSFTWFRENRVDGAKGDDNTDGLFINIDCTKNNPDDLLKGHVLYEKALAADVDYEFFASYSTGNNSELWRYRAPGTNHQGYYPTNATLSPPLMKMKASPSGGSEGKIKFTRSGNKTIYEGAISLNAIPELKSELSRLKPGDSYFPNLAWRVNGGNQGKKFWTIESGQWEEGGYGFVPQWLSGGLANGGRVISRWAFVNGGGK